MNTKHIQFNRQRLVAILFAGLSLALAAGLVWVGADTNGSTVQLVNIRQNGAYSLQPGQRELSATVDHTGADLGKDESGLQRWSYLKSVKGGKGGVQGGDNR